MPNKVGRTPELIFKEFEEDIHTRYSHQLAEKIKEAILLLEAHEHESEKQQAIWEWALASLITRDSPSERKRLKGRFGPLATREDGSQLPDPAIFTDEALAYYAERAAKTSNPIHRARYCDFLWEKRRNYNFARSAVDAYLECLPIYLANGWYHEVADAISRSMELALSVNDGKRITKVREHLLQAMDRLSAIGDHPALRYCLDLIDTLLVMKKGTTDLDFQKALDVCRKGVSFYASQNGGFMYHLARDFEERQALLWQMLRNKEETDNARARVGELYEKEAELKGAGSNMLAAIFLQEAAQHYANIGRSDKVEKLKAKVRHRWEAAADGGEFKRIETTVKLPTKQIDEYIQDIISQGINKALLIVSLDLNLVPDIERCRKVATEQKQEFPLLGLVPRSTLRGARRVAFASTPEEIDEANTLAQYSIDLGLGQIYLGRVFEMMRQDGGFTTDSLVSYMSSSPFFDEDKLGVIRVGIERYFVADYVSAVHILVPQLEDVLRRIIGKLGISTTSLAPDGLTREKPLNEVLNTPELKSLLGDRVWFYFKYVLDHQLGENLRNDVAHGLITKDRCTRQLTETVLHLFLRLTPYKVRNQTPAT